MHRSFLWLILAILGGCTPDPVDVVLITVDTLRVDHVSAYNPSSPSQTPAMDSLAKDGVLFTQAFSPMSVTAPAFASLMTGQHPGDHGVLMNLFRGGSPLPETAETLAERFASAKAGYATGGFVSAYTLRRQVGLRQGFQVYNGGERANRWGDQTISNALGWMAQHQGRPIFMWVHSYDPHGPVKRFAREADVSKPWKADPAHDAHIPRYQRHPQISDPDFYRQMYVHGVQYADHQVGRILSALRDSGRYEEALIIVLADHGESLTERDLWFDHGTSAHIEQLQIPLIVKYPRSKRGGTHDDRLTSLMDVTPTVLEQARLPALPRPAGLALTTAGTLHTQLTGESSHCKEVDILLCSPRGGLGKELSVRSLTTTLIQQARHPEARRLQYNRVTDPLEQTPVMDNTLQTDLTSVLEALVLDRRARTYADPPGIHTEQETDEDEKLRSLGYVE